MPPHRRTPSTAPFALLLALGVVACSPPNIAADPQVPEAPSVGEVQCSAVRAQTEPDLMGWDPGSRANLSRLRQEGIVAVRYQARGCNVELELLPNCIGAGANYTFRPYAERQTKSAHTAQELYAQLPVGAARLSAKLKGERSIRTDYMLVGTSSLPVGHVVGKRDLHGDCAAATHVVSSIYLGGFQMMAGREAELGAEANVFVVGAGAKTSASGERLDSAGDPDACRSASKDGHESTQCAAPLRIGLVAISEDAAKVPASVASSPAPPTPTPSPTYTSSEVPTILNENLFKAGQPELLSNAEGTLAEALGRMKAFPKLRYTIAVHTDKSGQVEKALNQQRADRVRAWLVAHGIEARRLTAEGWGNDKPRDNPETPEGQARNRRTEFRNDGTP